MSNGTPDSDSQISSRYRHFALREARGVSETYETWAHSVSRDKAVLTMLGELPQAKQQPNLVFASVRHHGAESSYESFRSTLVEQWEGVRGTILSRSTQTNEAARCAVLLPFLASMPQPVALIEIGASAGLCLLPDLYSYRYSDGTFLDPGSGPSPVVISAELGAGVQPPLQIPQVSWRAGIDLAPIDVTDAEACTWLETLIWPEQQKRKDRLRKALGVARRNPPRILQADLLEALPQLAAQAPADVTLIIFHSAVLSYLEAKDRTEFARIVHQLPAHWISNEGQNIVNSLPFPFRSANAMGQFILSIDGTPRALTDPHGGSILNLRF